MVVTESAMEYIFTKAYQAFTVNGSHGVCAAVCFIMEDFVAESVFSLKQWGGLFLVKAQAFPINMKALI